MAMAMEVKELEKEETEKEDKELAEDLLATGNALLSPPSSVEQLFPLLEKLENLLLGLKQSPAISLQMALNPAMKALTTKEFLNHLHLDVKVCVASCISEILRITAPDAPYSDELMKDVFKLIVAAFDNICDISSHLYKRRVSILETFTKVRLWVLMLDLECDLLILEMFDNFLRNIRENHPDVVFMSMGFIMIMVLEDIEEIPSELLSSLLGSARKGNQNVLPIARKLAERVIENCALKLAPYMHQAVQFAGFPLDNYGKIVAYICAQKSETVELRILASQDNSTKKHLKMFQSAKCNTQSVKKNNAMVRTPIKKSMMKDTPRKKRICVAPDNNKNFGEDLFRSRIRVPCSNEQMQEKKKPEINPCSVAGKTMKEGTPIREFDAEVPESGIDSPRSVENVFKSENKTLKDMGNTEQNSAVESKDGSDRSCSESKESAVKAAIKMKDDSLEPRTTENKDPPKMALEEGKNENGVKNNVATNLMLLKDLVPPKLKKPRTPRRVKDQPDYSGSR
ncbi:uncharacterized protein LOC105633610 isoform X2 [Jatropha curcas]|uniref:uncharacterized protein LOC105633610 isoform X2 n=1 Tax=Jatropha curcas TaxID=180498 RepID=UPI0009D6E58D|nr:uncharacterized protein LOC105633610 isoform X2 [Jatropha curcas]